MLRKSIAGLSLIAILATGAAAQAPFTQSFKVDGGGFPSVFTGEFNAGGNIGLTGELPNVAFQIWCVDPLQYANYSFTNALITPLNTPVANFANTDAARVESGHTAATGAAAQTEYLKAAYLALGMIGSHPLYSNSDYEDAIWTVMGYTGHTSTNEAAIVTAMGSSWTTITAGDWAVITGGPNDQEFIYHRPGGTTQSVTPEPATVSLMAMGMVSMAGAAVRRRRQRKA